MTKKLALEESHAEAEKPTRQAMVRYSFCVGKVQVIQKCAIRSSYDLDLHA